MTVFYCLLSGLLLQTLVGLADPVTITPARPRQTDLIRLAYCRRAPARLAGTGSEPIFARVNIFLQDGGIRKFHQRLRGTGDTLHGSFTLPPLAASLRIEFYTLNKEDSPATRQLLVYTPSGQQPVRSAYLESFYSDSTQTSFSREIAAYPDNYLAYARYFNALSLRQQDDTTHQRIRRYLHQLAGVDTTSAGLLTARCVGYAKTGELSRAKAYLLTLFTRFPEATETAFAFGIYNYEYYKASGHEVEPDVRQRLKQLFVGYPDGALSRNENVFRYLQGELDLPLSAFERVICPLYAWDRLAYHALTSLPEVYLQRGQRLDSALVLLQRGIGRFEDGTINHQFRLTTSHYQLYVPYMLLLRAQTDLRLGRPDQAIKDASAGLSLLTGSNTEGNFRPKLLAVRAGAYQQAGNANLAFRDYQQLYQEGHVPALDSLRHLFNRCQLRSQSFDEFVTSLQKKTASSTAPARPAGLPAFSGTDLQGQVVSSTSLAGKLVVINVWGLGCGPCIAEMPQLNELVRAFAHRPDVVFLAVTGDATAPLQSFLRRHPFAYQVINKVANMSQTFNTNALPVHLIIGKNGSVLSRSLGARDDIGVYLHQLILRNL